MGVQSSSWMCARGLLWTCLLIAAAYSPTRAAEHRDMAGRVSMHNRWFRRTYPHNSSSVYKPTLNITAQCPELRIGVINTVNFHFEVLASVLYSLLPYASRVDVLLRPGAQSDNYDGAWDFIRWFPGRRLRAQPSAIAETYGLVITISTDYEQAEMASLLAVMKPRVLVAYMHNAQSQLGPLLTLAPQVELLALSPHVSASLQRISNHTADWMLPVYPFPVIDDCLTFPPRWVLGMCLRGFAMQGRFSNLRRNYSSIWRQMIKRLESLRDPQVGRLFLLNVLGKGKDRLGLPSELETHVRVHRRLMYERFFDVIAHNVALVPSLASDRYYTEKFSSTVLASLISGTPILADEKLLQAYQFLTKDSTYMSQEGEEEVDTMLRIVRMPVDSLLKVRASLLDVRDRLNDRAARMTENYVRAACTWKESVST